jgi:hypothetical protein
MVDADITLRDRIEAVLWANFDDAAPSLSMRDMADAVIAELNLKIAVDYMSVDGQRRNFMLAGNYTTEKQ